MVHRRPRCDAGDVVRLYVDVRRDIGRACVPGRAVELVPLLVLREPPRDRMLPSAASDYKYLHLSHSLGIFIFCPMLSLSLLSPLTSLIFWTVESNAFAMRKSESPDWTVYSYTGPE